MSKRNQKELKRLRGCRFCEIQNPWDQEISFIDIGRPVRSQKDVRRIVKRGKRFWRECWKKELIGRTAYKQCMPEYVGKDLNCNYLCHCLVVTHWEYEDIWNIKDVPKSSGYNLRQWKLNFKRYTREFYRELAESLKQHQEAASNEQVQ